MLRISTVVDPQRSDRLKVPLEVLRISTVVDGLVLLRGILSFGSAKNFYCCRFPKHCTKRKPLEVLRISTVVDLSSIHSPANPLEVLIISTVVDLPGPSFRVTFGSAKNFYCCRYLHESLPC